MLMPQTLSHTLNILKNLKNKSHHLKNKSHHLKNKSHLPAGGKQHHYESNQGERNYITHTLQHSYCSEALML